MPEKIIHFRQVVWMAGDLDLPALLHAALAVRPNVNDTTFQRDGETLQVRHRHGTPTEMRLHISSHVPGKTKAITPRAIAAPAADLEEAVPPANSEFTEREIALVARGDRVGYVAFGLTHTKKVESAVRGLLALHHGAEIANRFFLAARADANMIQTLLEAGVDKLDFDLGLPSAEAQQVIDAQPLSVVERIGRQVGEAILTRVTADHEADDIDTLQQMKANLTLQLRKRKPTAEQVQSLTAIATDAIANAEQFRIRTIAGDEFTHDKLILKSSFSHPETATLHYVTAWGAIVAFLDRV